MLCVGAFFQSFADNVGIDAAKDKAAQFLMERSGNVLHSQSRTPVQTVPELEIAHVEMAQGDALYYVFDKGQDDGFIVVSAEDRTPAVLCYVDEGKFELDNMAPAAREMLNRYAEYIENIQSGTKLQAGLSIQKPIYPLLSTKWGQGDPYDMKCPGITGCVATALAQIMYYHRWPDAAVGTKTYTYTNGETLSVDFGVKYEYDNMLAAILDPADSVVANAVSTLMYHIGVASEMMYGESESGANAGIALDGMKRHFKYNEDARIEYADNYERAKWEAMLYNELAAERPVFYCGQGDYEAHAFVLDGYENGYFHINWGWCGLSDGYFLLIETTYPTDQLAFFDFKPIDHSYDNPQDGDGMFRLGYCDDAICAEIGGNGTVGGAILLPSEYLAVYKGKTISGMEIGLSAEAEDFEYFVFKAADGLYYNDIDIVTKEMLISGTVGKGKPGWNRILFDQPLEINGEDGLYLGYYVTNSTLSYPVGASLHEEWKDETMRYTGLYYQNGGWECALYLTINVRALIVNDDLPVDMRLLNVDNIRCETSDDNFNILISVESTSADTISNFTIGYQLDDGEIAYHTEECRLAPNKTNHYSIPVDIRWPAGVYSLKVWIEKVNGKPDAVPANSDYYRTNPVQLIIPGQKFERRTVMESYVSSMCGFSNKVTIADSILSEKYPDKFIGIIVHEGDSEDDPLNIHENYNWWAFVTPSARLNRITYEDPSVTGLENRLLAIEDADFDISMQACFSDSEKKNVEVLSTIVPGFDLNNEWYRVAYAVIENNVHVPGDPNTYQKIARGIYSNESGIFNSIPEKVKAGTTYQNSYTIKLPLNVDDPSQIVIVAMIVNKVTGEIENAYSCVPADNGDNRIEISEKAIDLAPNSNIQLKVTGVTDEMQLVWTSSNPDIVSVSQTGLVTAGSTIGKADVSVCVKGKPGLMSTCAIFVIDNPEITVPTPGSLSALLGDNINSFVKLKVTGSLNGLDLATLRKMATDGNLEILDISDARFITDNDDYYFEGNLINQDDVIPYRAFEECIKLKEFICPKTCTAIEPNAFMHCSSLKSITLNEGLKSIGFYAFDETAITELHLPASLTDISNECSNNIISTITIADGNDALACVDNVVYDKTMEKLLYYPGGKTDEEYVSQTVKICIDGEGGFSRNPYLRRVYLLNAEKVHLSNNNTFSFLYLGPNLKQFSLSLFWFNIGRFTTLLCAAPEPPVIENPDYIPEIYQEDWLGIVSLYVPKESMEAYKSDSIWGLFNIMSLDEYEGDSTYNKIQELFNTYFTVTYCIGDSVVHQDQVLYCDTIPEYAYEPQKEGYTFSGWSEIPATMPANDVVVNGTFRVNNYLLTYVVDDVIYQSDTLEYGSEIIPAEAPNAAGKTFMGWENLPAYMPAENIQVIGHLYSLLTGDANNDTEVNVGDFSSTVNYILERPAPGFVKLMADVDSNEDINVADVVGITNIILDYDYPSMAIGRSPNRESDVIDNFNLTQIAETEHDIIISLNMSSQNMFTAFQLDIDLPKGMVIKAARLSDNKDNSHMVSFGKLSNGEWRVISASLNGKQLKTDEVSLLILELERTEEDDSMLISVHDALFSDRNLNITEAVDCSLLLSGNPTCINKITVDDSEPVYNINGTKLTGDVSNGLFIINGKKVLKHE